jgi:signal transduction histidine kinase
VDAERRSLERDLREGALGRLGEAAGMLALIPDDPRAPSAEIVTALHRATESVTEFARGVHPRSLDLGGLSTAIGELTGASPLAVSASLPAVRLPHDVELTLYFVAAEALTNAVKHAGASRAAILLELADGLIRLTIADDGNGNGDLRAGGGLTGLADRLAVIGGALEIESVSGTGTTVMATVPGVRVDAAVGRWPVAR